MKIHHESPNLINILSDDDRVRISLWVDDEGFAFVGKSERIGTTLSNRIEQSNFSIRVDGKILDKHPHL